MHFSDGTLLFLKANAKNIEALKWILLGFENLSGMKVNFAKCEMIPLNISSPEGLHLASLIGCKVGTLPISYFGIPLHWKKLNKKDQQPLVDKIGKKTSNLKK